MIVLKGKEILTQLECTFTSLPLSSFYLKVKVGQLSCGYQAESVCQGRLSRKIKGSWVLDIIKATKFSTILL